MVCPDLKCTTEHKHVSDSYGSYKIYVEEQFRDCMSWLCPFYSEREKKQYCSKYRPEPVNQ